MPNRKPQPTDQRDIESAVATSKRLLAVEQMALLYNQRLADALKAQSHIVG